MITSLMRSTVALLTAIVFSVTFAGSPALADDDDDDNGGAVILNVTVDFGLEQMVITGEGFQPLFSSGDPVVTLGGDPLTVTGSTDLQIVADCPLEPPITGTPFCADGDFLLVVTPDGGDDDDDDDGGLKVAYDLTIGAVGPQGPQGADGAPGGFSGTKVIRTDTSIRNGQKPVISVSCPPGFVVTGGGFGTGSKKNITVFQNHPVASNNSLNATIWRVQILNDVGETIGVQVYAICVETN